MSDRDRKDVVIVEREDRSWEPLNAVVLVLAVIALVVVLVFAFGNTGEGEGGGDVPVPTTLPTEEG